MDACRICRGEAEPDEPLYHPCKCSGSIRFVHETCLIEWINHSGNGKKCDLCHTPYTFKKVYSSQMPSHLPVKAYAYALLVQLQQSLSSLNLLCRCVLMLLLTVFAVKYSVESANYFADDHLFWPTSSAANAAAGSGSTVGTTAGAGNSTRVARFLTIANGKAWPVQELAHSLEVGLVLTAGVLAAALLFYTVCEMTFNEPVLIHDLDHIINGEPGHLDFPEEKYPDRHNVQEVVRDAAGPAAVAAVPAVPAAGLAVVPPAGPAAVPAAAAAALEAAAARTRPDGDTTLFAPPSAVGIPAPSEPPATDPNEIMPLVYEGPLTYHFKRDHGHHGRSPKQMAIPKLTMAVLSVDDNGSPVMSKATTGVLPVAALGRTIQPIQVPPPPGGRLDLPSADAHYRLFFDSLGLEVLDAPGSVPFNKELTPNYTTRVRRDAQSQARQWPPVVAVGWPPLGGNGAPITGLTLRDIIYEQSPPNARLPNSTITHHWIQEGRGYHVLDILDSVENDVPRVEAARVGGGDAGDDMDEGGVADDDDDWSDIGWEDDEDRDINNVDDLFGREDADAELDEWNFVAIVEQLVGGPMVPAFVGFGWFLVAVVSMILVFYYLPTLTGRSVVSVVSIVSKAALKAAWNALPESSRARLDCWPIPSVDLDPTQLSMRLATMYVGYAFLLSVTHSVYNLFYFRLLGDEQGRAVLMFLKQAHAVIKVFHAMVIELVAFPMFCGVNIHLALLPLLPWRGVGGTLALVRSHVYTFAIAYWAGGLIYMFLLAGFLSSCRRFLRRGVLYFVEDPSDPRSEPVKKILNNTFANHMRKMAISALIYVGLIVGGIGAGAGLLRLALPELWPLHVAVGPQWSDAEKWPLLVLLNAAISRGVFSKAAWTKRLDQFWKMLFQMAAARLDLESFLFDAPKDAAHAQHQGGTFVRAPSIDTFKSRKNLELFPVVDANDHRPDGKRRAARELRKYTVVWRPRFFWLRVAGLFVFLWAYAALALAAGLGGSYLVGLGANKYLWTTPLQNSLLVLFSGMMLTTNTVLVVREAGGVRALPLALLNIVAAGLCFNYGNFNQLIAPPFTNVSAPSDSMLGLTLLIGLVLTAALGPQHTTLGRVALVGSINAVSWFVPQSVITAVGYVVRPLVFVLVLVGAVTSLGADGALETWSSTARDAFYLEATVLQNRDDLPGDHQEPVPSLS